MNPGSADARHESPLPGGATGLTQLPTRGEIRAAHAHLTITDLWAAAVLADTTDELDVVGHLSLLLHGHPACTRPVTRPDGRITESLHQVIRYRRSAMIPDTRARDLVAATRDHAERTRRGDLHELAATKERLYQDQRPRHPDGTPWRPRPDATVLDLRSPRDPNPQPTKEPR